ncbi:hypothetical protein [Paenibacillus sp. UNC496MF]|uniref:hypothetical protein n=1 Tax=Paenibacillus sp. UNC496MF TaxID=1502753 RepID=UPI000A4D5DCA|nr:hypothetical protein [Paenibacillus sp. UNC496MF]
MNLICESQDVSDYLAVTAEVDHDHPMIAELTSKLAASSQDQADFVKQSHECYQRLTIGDTPDKSKPSFMLNDGF